MGYPLATPAPHVQPHDGKIARNPDHFSVRASSKVHVLPHSTWTSRGEDFDPNQRSTLSTFGKSLDIGLADTLRLPDDELRDLPSVPTRKPHPQSFKDALAFSRPKFWPAWWDLDQEEIEAEESPRPMMKSSSAPLLASEQPRPKLKRGTGIKPFDGDPESVLSPFAIQARRYGADVVITGQKLRPSTSALFSYKIIQQPAGSDARGKWPSAEAEGGGAADPFPAPPAAQARATSQSAPHSRGGRRHGQQLGLRHKEPFRGPGYSGRPSNRPPSSLHGGGGSRRGQRQRDAPRHSEQQRQQQLGPSLSDRRAGSAGTMNLEEGADIIGGQEHEAHRPSPPPRLATLGPGTGLWDGTSKLNTVRDLLDGYAADPLGGARPSSSSSFLEKYVERQAEIERLLQERGQPPSGAAAA
mmetsp:Transcript_146525/g.365385  ORF Transcript_146525/g.365385 Transcript_146525/m.365385 type:complete len:413 (+) Transcript_146525:106-1344(+)